MALLLPHTFVFRCLSRRFLATFMSLADHMLFKLGNCISKRVRLVGEKEFIDNNFAPGLTLGYVTHAMKNCISAGHDFFIDASKFNPTTS